MSNTLRAGLLGILFSIQVSLVVISVATFGDNNPVIVLPLTGVLLAAVIFFSEVWSS